MESRLFDVDFHLLHDSILFIIAFIIPLVFIIGFVCILIVIIKSIKKKNDCDNCPYNDNKPYH